MFIRTLIILLILSGLTGCSYDRLRADPRTVIDDPAAYKATEEITQIIARRDTDALLAKSHPEFQKIENIANDLGGLWVFLPDGDDLKFSLHYAAIGQGTGPLAGQKIYLLNYDVEGDTLFAELVIHITSLEGECCVLTNINVTRTRFQPSDYYKFTFEGKGIAHYIVFGLLFLVPTLMIITAIHCGRNKLVRRKILWIIFIIIGLQGFEFNWTTGQFIFELLHVSERGMQIEFFSIHILGASILRTGLFTPWLITIGSPVGAILYWLGPARRQAEVAPPDTSKDEA